VFLLSVCTEIQFVKYEGNIKIKEKRRKRQKKKNPWMIPFFFFVPFVLIQLSHLLRQNKKHEMKMHCRFL